MDVARVERVDISVAVANPLLDSDGDGIPDAWEVTPGLNASNAADGTADSDDDGMSNHHEYLAGTNPFDPTSCLRLVGMTPLGGGAIMIRWTSESNKIYRLQSSANLTTGFTNLVTGVSPTPPYNTLTPTNIENAGFYRIQLQTP